MIWKNIGIGKSYQVPEEITKYKTRKMYSKSKRMYVTLSDIKDTLQKGGTVLVKDHNGVDITSKVLGKVAALSNATTSQYEELITGGN